MNDSVTNQSTTNGSKHTPGPWEVWEGHYSVYATGPNTENERGWIKGTRRPICEMLEDTGSESEEDDHEEMAANALVIAAAPDLLDACKKAAERGYTFGDLGLPGVEMPSREALIKWSEDMFSLYTECQTAIDKATGATGKTNEDEEF